MLKRSMLPAAFEELAVYEKHRLVPMVGENKGVDERLPRALGDFHQRGPGPLPGRAGPGGLSTPEKR